MNLKKKTSSPIFVISIFGFSKYAPFYICALQILIPIPLSDSKFETTLLLKIFLNTGNNLKYIAYMYIKVVNFKLLFFIFFLHLKIVYEMKKKKPS